MGPAYGTNNPGLTRRRYDPGNQGGNIGIFVRHRYRRTGSSSPHAAVWLSIVLATGPTVALPAWVAAAQQRAFEPAAHDPRGRPRLPGGEPNRDYDPRYDPGSVDYDYDAASDEDHPLRGPRRPDAAWDDMLPQAEGDWKWGDVYFDGTYTARLQVSNDCTTGQTVYLSWDNPYLTLPESDRIPPGGKTVVGTIKTPPAPAPPIFPGGGPAPSWPGGWGWGHVTLPPGVVPPPGWHQPNFLNVEGEVEAWHPWDPGASCAPNVTTWKISGHVHFRPPGGGDDGGGGPAVADACQVYWLTGELPPGLEERDLDEACLDRIRELAVEWRERIVAPYAERSPSEWAWLPSAGEMRQMSVADLMGVRERGDSIMDRTSGTGS